MSLPALLKAEKLCQVAIVVRDIEAAAKQWSAILGVPMSGSRETQPESQTGIRYKGKPTDARAKLAFFHGGPVAIELIQPIGQPSVWNDLLVEHGDSVHHIAYRVEDMDATLKALEAAGCPTVQRGNFKGGQYAYIETRKQLGVMIELLATR